MSIVTQLDRNSGSYEGDGDWTSTRRYLLQRDSDFNTLSSPVVQDLGEEDMGRAQTLVDFVTWAVNSYPADHYVLILSDHGAGWYGGVHRW